MVNQTKVVWIGWLLISVLSCTEQPTNPPNDEQQVQATLSHIPGCGGHPLAKTVVDDSCFSYRFDQDLIVDFCVVANCCPDSQRFDFAYEIRNDSIVVAVTDTAANLCRCLCTYVIHAEFSNLPLDQYVFYCQYSETIVYSEVVKRNISKAVVARREGI